MKQIRLIALDIDGTLTNDDKLITPRTQRSLMRAQQQGVIVVLASGRPACGLARYSHQLQLGNWKGKLISFNGGQLSEAEDGRILYERKMEQSLAHEVLHHLKDYYVTVMLCDGEKLVVEDENGYQVEYEANCNHLKVIKTDSLEEYLTFSPYKVLSSANPEYLTKIWGELSAPFAGRLSAFFSAPFYYEFVPLGVNKGDALEKLCQSLHISRGQVLCFGDEHNDISMMKFAGHSVAMGNACDALKKVADEITLSNNEDGIAAVVERYLD